jgi:iron complex outermembrane receptor protein
MNDSIIKPTAIATGVALALGTISLPALAQESGAIEEVVVTGSYIRRSEYEGRAPLQMLNAADIEATGAAQPVEFLKQITANSGSQFYNETNDRAGVSQFNVRGLGLGSTLTLINGKRAGVAAVADDTGTDFLDINQFPIAMIERVEVLTDGASAIYGSQAVAGVANIITRKGFEGFEVSAGYATSEIDAWNLNLAAGSQFERGGFNVYATYYDQGHIERSEFDWMEDRLIGQGDISRSRFLSSTGAPGSYRRATLDPVNGEATDVSGAGNTPDPDCLAAGGVFLNPADIGRQDNTCRYHFVDQVSVISAEQRVQVFTEFEWEFTENLRYYAEASYSNNLIKRDSGGATLNTGRANGGGITILGDHPFNFYVEDPNDDAGLIWVGPEDWDNDIHTGATLRAIQRPLGAEVNNSDLTQQIKRELDYRRFMNGVEVSLSDSWYMDFSYGWSRSSRITDDPHTYRSSVYQDLVRQGLWNPFGSRLATPDLVSPKDGTSRAGTDQVILDQFDAIGVSTSKATEQVVDLVFSGDLFEAGFGTLQGAFGAQWRKTDIESVPDSLSAAGEANEQGLTASVKGSQDVTAVFGEVVIPVNDLAEFQVAVRYEDYGGGVDTTDPKLSFNIAPLDWVAFRGSWGTSFQAPTVRQTATASSSAFIDDPASPTGPGGSLICNSTGLNNNITVSVEGSPDLVPQSSENWNLGAIFTVDRFRTSIDYFNFDYEDLIAQSEGAQAIVDNDCLNDGVPNDPRVIRDAGGQLREVLTQFVNIGKVKTDGIDINMDYNMDVANGLMTFNLGATYVNKFDVDTTGDGTIDFDGAGNRNFRNNFSTMPEWRGVFGVGYLVGGHTINANVNYVDSYLNDQSNNARVKSWTTLDLQYNYTWSGLIGSGNTTLTVGATNVTDEDPPPLSRQNSDGSPVTRFNPDGTYNRGWIDRPGYDDRAGHDLRGRTWYVRFKQTL